MYVLYVRYECVCMYIYMNVYVYVHNTCMYVHMCDWFTSVVVRRTWVILVDSELRVTDTLSTDITHLQKNNSINNDNNNI